MRPPTPRDFGGFPPTADVGATREKKMRNFVITLVVVLTVLATCTTGLATEYRFKGGGYDGYDWSTYWFPNSSQYVLIKYTGGWYDGYTRCMGTNLTISIRGTIIIIR